VAESSESIPPSVARPSCIAPEQKLDGGTAGEPWLIATAATDVVVVDRQRRAWRIDLAEQVPHRMALNGIDKVSASSTLLAALQHRPPLLIFNLYLVDGKSGAVLKWSPLNTLPVVFPGAPENYLSAKPDLPANQARDLRVDTHLWLLQAKTVTRVNFGTPLGQADYALDPPPDAEVRPKLDYRLLDGATVGDRDYLYVYDAANARILAFGYADGAFVRQWLAPRSGAQARAARPSRRHGGDLGRGWASGRIPGHARPRGARRPRVGD